MPFKIPSLSLSSEVEPLVRQQYTIRALLTNIENNSNENIINMVFPDGNILEKSDQEVMSWLTNRIHERIDLYNSKPNDDLLLTIFHSIQVWGGNTARAFYFNDGANKNLKLDGYKSAVNYLRNGDVNKAVELFRKSVNSMNIAFASKHFSFWTADFQGRINENKRQLPILDGIIFKLVYGQNSPNYSHYNRYLVDMYKFVSKHEGITVGSLERQLFNFADTAEGRQWIKQRLENGVDKTKTGKKE